MKTFILAVDSLINTFSIVDAGKEILFTYQNKDSAELFDAVSENDMILGYFGEPSKQVKCVFSVAKKHGSNTLSLIKTLEVSEGASVTDELANLMEDHPLQEIANDDYEKLVKELRNATDAANIDVPYEDIMLVDNKTISEEDFRIWLSQCVKKDGQLLSTTYQNAYFYILKAVPSMLGFDSVFSITDPVAFDQYRQEIEASKQYQEANPNVGVGTLSAALTNYGLYLDERHMINIPAERLGQVLKEWCDKKYVENNITSTLVGFGFKYARAINKAKVTSKALLDLAKIESTMAAYIDRGKDLAASIEKDSIGITILPTKTTAKEAQENNIWLPRINTLHPLNSILYGAPGTGKTYITAEYALAILENRAVDESQKAPEQRKTTMEKYRNFVDEGRIVFTTFHQSYGYEDFIQGLRPVSANGGTDFIPIDGVFKRIADTAKKHPDNNYVIIIDEINRANISKVFGELITLIEDDKRWGEVNALQVTLPSGDPFAIPNNLYIVGTMNSADKSISLIDTALRRRFEFIEVTPNVSLIADPVLRSVLEKLNISLAKELDSTDLLVGHAYFIGKTEEDLCNIFNRSIIPLLYEYFYDNSTKVKAQIKNALPNDQYEITGGTVGRIKISKK